MPFTPHDAATHALDRAEALLRSSLPTKHKPPVLRPSVRVDMRRLSMVMAVAALDTYMHRLIVARAYSHELMPAGLARLDLPFELLLAQADATKAAAHKKPHKIRPRTRVKRSLRDRLLRETFQRYEDVARALSMAGHPGAWKAVGQKMSPPMTTVQIRERLDAIVRRRNQIVHEGDYRRLDRPQDSGRNVMTHKQAQSDIRFIRDLVEAIHAVV